MGQLQVVRYQMSTTGRDCAVPMTVVGAADAGCLSDLLSTHL
jgi:hypothetical protein